MDTVRVMQVVETTIRRRGDGTEENPNRVITQYWAFDGRLLAELDPWESPALAAAASLVSQPVSGGGVG